MGGERIWILLNGDYAAPDRPPQNGETVIAVDGGIRHASTLNIRPTLWLGDFDSSTPLSFPDIARETYPQNKNQTDFELALAHAETRYPQAQWHIIGSAGDEADHAFANLWVLGNTPGRCILWQKHATLFCAGAANDADGSVRWQGKSGDKISLFAFAPLLGAQSRGLRWPLTKHVILPYSAHGARNEMTENQAEICWQSGRLLLFLPPSCRLES